LDLGNLVSTAAIILTLASAAGLGLMRSHVTGLRETTTDLRGRVTDLEGERISLRESNAKLIAKVAAVEAENKMLTTRLTGKVEWLALTDQLEEHHRQALVWWKETSQMMADILKVMRELRSG
jgi:hypothetical protein